MHVPFKKKENFKEILFYIEMIRSQYARTIPVSI